MSHTPGPWERDGLDIFASNGLWVATVYQWHPHSIQDASMIAAAPELLAFAEWVGGVNNGDGTVSYVDDGRDMREVAAAVVKKARGE